MALGGEETGHARDAGTDAGVPPHVLVVDDNPDALDLLSRLLGKLGYAVQIAASGHEALTLFEEKTPAAVLLDLRMPRMDGAEVFAKLRQIGPHVPIIVVSASWDEASARALLRRGAFDYMRKPIDIDYLAVVVGAATARLWPSASLSDRRQPMVGTALSVTQLAYTVMGVARSLEGPDSVRQQLEDLAREALREALLGHAERALRRLVEIRRWLADGTLGWLRPAAVQTLRTALEPLDEYLSRVDGEGVSRPA